MRPPAACSSSSTAWRPVSKSRFGWKRAPAAPFIGATNQNPDPALGTVYPITKSTTPQTEQVSTLADKRCSRAHERKLQVGNGSVSADSLDPVVPRDDAAAAKNKSALQGALTPMGVAR